MRVAVLAAGWAGFNDAACRHLAERGVELLVVYPTETTDTAYREHEVESYARTHRWSGEPAPGDVAGVVADFAPDAVLVHSWHFGPYREALRAVAPGTLRVLWMDNVWRNIPKQWLGRAVAPWYVRPLYDCVMVPSDRTEFFARRLGFGEGDVIRGSLSADTSLFGSPPRTAEELASRRRFLACLRLVRHKGADVLAEAYDRYRTESHASGAEPWGLDVVGIGPMAPAFDGLPGVTMVGFAQPEDVAERMRAASCLVIPSREDPYGVVVHEGALSGLPLVSTYFVGATPFFVQDGVNGWTVPRADAAALATAMGRVAALDGERLAEMSSVSRSLGSRLSSQGWARNLHEQLVWRLADLRAARD